MLVNLPGMLYAGALVERICGPGLFVGLYLANCCISAGTQMLYQRQVGYRQYRKRGRQANHNGNITLFLMSFFTTLVP